MGKDSLYGLAVIAGVFVVFLVSSSLADHLVDGFVAQFALTFALFVGFFIVAAIGYLVVAFREGSREWKREEIFEDPIDQRQINLKIIEEAHRKQYGNAVTKATSIISDHIETLARRRDALIRKDHYGVIDNSKWNIEINHFIANVIQPQLSGDYFRRIEMRNPSVISETINRLIDEHERTRPHSDEVPPGISPLDFEGLCARVLSECGWDASTTQGSGDQGADVVAQKNGKRLVVQCKIYTGVVGNKSVQEVLGAKSYYNADLTAVVCTTQYTKSATQLAQVSGVAISMNFGIMPNP
ncbi:restriction endonuclease [Paracoccus thiocyanatus]|uniref:Restriction endonuclease type IV Mrr domain-containing protein n=1 Tax=Paracoccus thiocyanatus TaxID=34006 RepID=A0A3D8PBX8_9RHOB|nr:restriction endonuclease [Paracoccus thiocyanatus]RDW13583.1 hypothetical protein DIE28_07210 [Paracoccus thiocyanatus]